MTKEQTAMLEQVQEASMAVHAQKDRANDDVESVKSAFENLHQAMASDADQTDKDNEILETLVNLFVNVQ